MTGEGAADEPVTPEMRARADAVVERLRALWAARDAEAAFACAAFDRAFRAALRRGRPGP